MLIKRLSGYIFKTIGHISRKVRTCEPGSRGTFSSSPISLKLRNIPPPMKIYFSSNNIFVTFHKFPQNTTSLFRGRIYTSSFLMPSSCTVTSLSFSNTHNELKRTSAQDAHNTSVRAVLHANSN